MRVQTVSKSQNQLKIPQFATNFFLLRSQAIEILSKISVLGMKITQLSNNNYFSRKGITLVWPIHRLLRGIRRLNLVFRQRVRLILDLRTNISFQGSWRMENRRIRIVIMGRRGINSGWVLMRRGERNGIILVSSFFRFFSHK